MTIEEQSAEIYSNEEVYMAAEEEWDGKYGNGMESMGSQMGRRSAAEKCGDGV